MNQRPGNPARSVVSAGLLLFIGTALGNLASYGVVIALSRSLAPADLGAVGTLMAVSTIGSVVGLGAQLAAARAVAVGPEPEVMHSQLAAGLRVGALLMALTAAAAPVLGHLFGIGLSAVLMVALGSLPMTMALVLQGILHGRRQFLALSLATALVGTLRLVAAVLADLLHHGPTGVMAWIAAAWAAAAAAGWLLAGRPIWSGIKPPWRAAARDFLHAAAPMSGLIMLSGLDLLLVRHLTPDASGSYTVGSLFERAAFWGLGFIATLAYPRLAQDAQRIRGTLAALLATTALGCAGLLLARLAGTPLVVLAGGQNYRDLGPHLWMFVLVGVALAILQLLAYLDLAQHGRAGAFGLWGTAAMVAAVVRLHHDTVPQMALAVAAVLWVAVALGTALLLIPRRRPVVAAVI